MTDISHSMIQADTEPTGACLRLIGNFTLSPSVGIVAEVYNISVGIAVVSQAVTSQVPTPVGDPSQDWYYWSVWSGILSPTSNINQTVTFDIRTSRRLREGYRLVFVSENVIQELASDVRVRLRTLWRMP